MVMGCRCQRAKTFASRRTWASSPPDNVRVVFVEGGARRESFSNGTLLVTTGDRYSAFIHKVMRAYGWSLGNAEYDYMVKADDDAYVDLEMLARLRPPRAMCGVEVDFGGPFIGGSLYVIPRELVSKIRRGIRHHDPAFRYWTMLGTMRYDKSTRNDGLASDVYVTGSARYLGFPTLDVPWIQRYTDGKTRVLVDGPPLPPGVVGGYDFTPSQMRKLYAERITARG